MKRKSMLLCSVPAVGIAALLYATSPALPPLENVHVGDGDVYDVIHPDEISTKHSDSSETVVVEGTGDAVFWSLKRVVLKPGFRASPTLGGYFHAMAETDSNSDGIPDWWMQLHNPSQSHGSELVPGHNMTLFQVFLYGRDPNASASGAGMVPGWVAQAQGSGPYNWNVSQTSWVDPSASALGLSVSQPENR